MFTPTQTFTTLLMSKPLFVPPAGRLIAGYAGGSELPAQNTAVVRYCRRNFDQPLNAYYQEGVGSFSWSLTGPAMRDLLKDVEANSIGVIIVESLDRISGDFRHLDRFARLCRQLDIQLHSATAGHIRIPQFTGPDPDTLEHIAAASKPELATIATATF